MLSMEGCKTLLLIRQKFMRCLFYHAFIGIFLFQLPHYSLINFLHSIVTELTTTGICKRNTSVQLQLGKPAFGFQERVWFQAALAYDVPYVVHLLQWLAGNPAWTTGPSHWYAQLVVASAIDAADQLQA